MPAPGLADGNPVADLPALRSVRAETHDGWAGHGQALAEFGDAYTLRGHNGGDR
ncbi:MAG TPA: hypothetical protein VKZ50_18790 [bacterium]|nr:hypothetical protein [bacterium]